MQEQTACSEEYRQARAAFDTLNIGDQAVFLVESVVAVMARGLEEAGRTLAHALDDLFRPAPEAAAEEDEAAPEAEPKKSKRGKGPAADT
jgi:hypothetical protein